MITSLAVSVIIVCGAIRRKWAVEPLYRARGPSVVMVFHRQSMGFLYREPTVRPPGSCMVGWLYILVKVVSAGCIITKTQTPETELLARYDHMLPAGRIPLDTN